MGHQTSTKRIIIKSIDLRSCEARLDSRSARLAVPRQLINKWKELATKIVAATKKFGE